MAATRPACSGVKNVVPPKLATRAQGASTIQLTTSTSWLHFSSRWPPLRAVWRRQSERMNPPWLKSSVSLNSRLTSRPMPPPRTSLHDVPVERCVPQDETDDELPVGGGVGGGQGGALVEA